MSPEELKKKQAWRSHEMSRGLLGCPFCGRPPVLIPTRPDIDGDAWAAVCCKNKRCVARPQVRDGCYLASARINYYAKAAKRWNRRAFTEVQPK